MATPFLRIFLHSLALTCLWLLMAPSAHAQRSAEEWLRVMTDEETTVDVARLSLNFKSQNSISARFRIQTTSKTRTANIQISTFEFDTSGTKYRIVDAGSVSEQGEILKEKVPGSEWRPIVGRLAPRLFSAALQLRPLGIWKVVSYRFLSGEAPSPSDPPELADLIGSAIRLEPSGITAGRKSSVCSGLLPSTLSSSDFQSRTGGDLKKIGIVAGTVPAFTFVCKANAATILLQPSPERMILLWEGVFLELERPKNPFLP